MGQDGALGKDQVRLISSKARRAEAMLAMIQQIFDAPQVDLSLLGA